MIKHCLTVLITILLFLNNIQVVLSESESANVDEKTSEDINQFYVNNAEEFEQVLSKKNTKTRSLRNRTGRHKVKILENNFVDTGQLIEEESNLFHFWDTVDEDSLAIFSNEDGTVELIEIVQFTTKNSYDFDDEIIFEELQRRFPDHVPMVYYLYSPVHKISMAQVIVDEVPFVIPFTSRPDLYGIKNGSLYEVEEFRGLIYDTFPNGLRSSDLQLSGNVEDPKKDVSEKDSFKETLIAVFALTTSTVFTVVLIRKKNQ